MSIGDAGGPGRSVLVVAAHPDDEALGCGGTLARHAANGDRVHLLFLSDGESSRDTDAAAIARRQDAARVAAEILGARGPAFVGLPDNRLDSVDLLDIVQRVETEVARLGPATIYTHHAGDLNVDHRIVHQAVMTACRPLPGSPVRVIYAFETVSSTEWQSSGNMFQPQRWVDIKPFLRCKRRALEAYAAEMRPFPHARSFEAVEALARVRGASVGLEAAECFMVVREIVR